MKQRLQKLVVLGLAVATVAGSSVPAYAAEIVPNANVEATAEVPTTEEEVTPKDEQKPEGENGEENPNEDTQAPTVQATATWNGSGDVVLQFNPNGLTEGSYFGCDAGIYFGDAETGYNADEPEVVVDYEAGTITVPEASLKAMIKSVEAWLEEAGNPQKFESGTGELIFYFDVNGDGEFNYADGDIDTLTNIKMSVKDAGTTDPEQKPDGGEQKPDGGDTQKPDGGDTQKPDGGDTQKPGEDGNQQGGDQKPNGDENNNGDTQKPSVKPQTKPEVKPQKDDTTTTPKTGDPSAVAGLLGTSMGSLGVALMAFKRRFRK